MSFTADINAVAVVGSYLPRQCGIATFTNSLLQAISGHMEEGTCRAVAMTDKGEGYDYPPEVSFEIRQDEVADYRIAADFLNLSQPQVVCLQHEYGLFGGSAGSHILKLLTDLRVPIVTTLHTILLRPDQEHREVMLRLAQLSDALVVMSRKAVDILKTVYGIDERKIACIPHGIPDLPFADPVYDKYKESLGLAGKKLLLTFGLLSQNKGLEHAIRSLPPVVERFPDLVYLILGATHPHVLKSQGESYRHHLQSMVKDLGLEDHVLFHNRFVSQKELCEYLAAADIYLTPYLSPEQITSGTLAYAMGSGKPVVSTPYWHAEEMLADQRGLLVPFHDAGAISDALITLLSDDAKRDAMQRRAYDFSRGSVWPAVGRSYLELFAKVTRQRRSSPRAYRPLPPPGHAGAFSRRLPAMKLNHMLLLTDDAGMRQHARFTVADRDHGYCTDDNARALLLSVQARELLTELPSRSAQAAESYLGFLVHAFNEERGRFRNFMTFGRRWLEEQGSEDSHGRALWALGITAASPGAGELSTPARLLFRQALTAVRHFTSPRALAFTLIGIHGYLAKYAGDSLVQRTGRLIAERLYEHFPAAAGNDWPWPEEVLTYDNAKLPHALILSGQWLGRDDMVDTGCRVLRWLGGVQMRDGHFVPVGNDGWYRRGQPPARFDQQPLEAHAMIDACHDAWRVDRDPRWLEQMMPAFNWFLGHNDLGLPLYDDKTGGCRDGLEATDVNQNQGAESTLAWLLSLAILQRLSMSGVLRLPDEQRVTNTALRRSS